MGRKKYKLGLKYLLSLFTEIQEVQEKSSFRKPASMHKYLIRHLFLYILLRERLFSSFYGNPIGLKVCGTTVIADSLYCAVVSSVPAFAPRTHVEVNGLLCPHLQQACCESVYVYAVVGFNNKWFSIDNN